MKNLISLKTERMLLLAMMEHPQIMRYTLSKLYPALFGHEKTREIFDRMTVLIGHGKPIPSPLVMANDPGISKGAAALLASRAALNDIKKFSVFDADASLNTLEYYRGLRVMYESAKDQAKALEESKTSKDLEKIKADVMASFQKIADSSSNEDMLTIGCEGNITTEYLVNKLKGTRKNILPTGFPEIDRKINGWRLSDVVLVTAQRGQGKSMLTKTLGLKHFYDKRNVVTINLEMGSWSYLSRLFSEESGLTHAKLRNNSHSKKILDKVVATKKRMDAYGALHGCRWSLKTICDPNYTIEKVHNELKYQNYQACIIDYVNLLGGSLAEMWQRLYYIAQYAKLMAKDLNMLIYLITQLNDAKRVKYGRGLEEACDVWLYWDNLRKEKKSPSPPNSNKKYYDHQAATPRGENVDKNKKKVKKSNGIIKVRIKHGKARDYEPFNFTLGFDGKTTRFISLIERKELKEMKKANKKKKERN